MGGEWSTFSWQDRCAQAQRVGFTGLGCGTPTSSTSWRRPRCRRCPAIFDDHGLKYLEVEFLADFFAEPGSPARQASDRQRKQLFDDRRGL